MPLTKNQKLMLYSLGLCLKQLNKRFENKPLAFSFSKIVFIEILKESGLITKTERALYKNLEDLEKKKFIKYQGRNLIFTERGLKNFNFIQKELNPFLETYGFWTKEIKPKRKLLTVIKTKSL